MSFTGSYTEAEPVSDFVKRERNTIATPVVKENHAWDFAHVRHLCCAGKHYVGMNISKDVIGCASHDSDSSLSTMRPLMRGPLVHTTSTLSPIGMDDNYPQ